LGKTNNIEEKKEKLGNSIFLRLGEQIPLYKRTTKFAL